MIARNCPALETGKGRQGGWVKHTHADIPITKREWETLADAGKMQLVASLYFNLL